IDFLPVDCESTAGSAKSGDAIALRFTSSSDGQEKVVVIDGGFQATGEQLVAHVLKYYGTDHVDLAISTHPDGDHINGLIVVIENKSISYSRLHRRAWNLLDGALGMLPFEETLTDLGETDPRNETSVITLLQVDGHRLLFTGDAGQRALIAAAEDYETRIGS